MKRNSPLSAHGLSALLALSMAGCSPLERFIGMMGNDSQSAPASVAPVARDSSEGSERVPLAIPSPSSPPVLTPLVKKFSALADDERRATLSEVVRELAGKYVFPVPEASARARREALSINQTYYEFGADRGRTRKHNGADIYSFGETVVAFANGTVVAIGRHIYKFDFGNMIVLHHGSVQGHELYTYYMHIGAVSDRLAAGVQVRRGEPLARVDCTGISDDQWHPYLGTRMCRPKGHLHFQVRLDDMHVNPDFFFPDYTVGALSRLRDHRLAIAAQDLNGRIFPFTGNQSLGSYTKPVK